MKKKYVLAVVIILSMGMAACSFGPKEGGANSEAVSSEAADTEALNAESSETNAARSDEKEDSDAVEIPRGDPIVAVVDRYEDNIIVARDMDDEAILYYFSTKDAEVIEGESPIAAGDIVEITYQGVQGDEEHPGTAVKVVAESMMYKFLSESEIIGFNTDFFNSEADRMNNMLLSGEYSNPGEVDLFQLFYNGTGGEADQISEEELELLTEMDSTAPYLDIMKITTGEMDTFLQERMGIGLEETKKKGLDNFYYLEEYDSYYVIAGDTNYVRCTVISGLWEADDKLRLEYEKESEEGRWKVTLQKEKDGYLFISNVRVD